MKNNKILGLIAWVLGLTFSLLLIFFVPKNLTESTYAVSVCTVLVYLLHLTLWLALQKGKVAQSIWAIIVSFASAVISAKTAILVSVLLIIIQVFVIVLAIVSKNHIESVNKRQKDHHIEL